MFYFLLLEILWLASEMHCGKVWRAYSLRQRYLILFGFITVWHNTRAFLTDSPLPIRQMYYRQKGQRTPTRPQAIHENFDLCAEALVQRLMSYKTQAEEYHNSCIQGEGKYNLENCGSSAFCGLGLVYWLVGLWISAMENVALSLFGSNFETC